MKRSLFIIPIIIQLLIFSSFLGNAQRNLRAKDCYLISKVFNIGVTAYHSYLKSDTIYFENTTDLDISCFEKIIIKGSIINFKYLDSDTTLFIIPKFVVGLNYYNFKSKSKFLRLGLHKVHFIQETGNWETALQGNIEIYFERKKKSIFIKKIRRNF